MTKKIPVPVETLPDIFLPEADWSELEALASVKFEKDLRRQLEDAISAYRQDDLAWREAIRFSEVKPLVQRLAIALREVNSAFGEIMESELGNAAYRAICSTAERIEKPIEWVDFARFWADIYRWQDLTLATVADVSKDKGPSGNPHIGRLLLVAEKVFLNAGGQPLDSIKLPYLEEVAKLVGSTVNSQSALAKSLQKARKSIEPKSTDIIPVTDTSHSE